MSSLDSTASGLRAAARDADAAAPPLLRLRTAAALCSASRARMAAKTCWQLGVLSQEHSPCQPLAES